MLAPASETTIVPRCVMREAERHRAAGGGHDGRAGAAEAVERERLEAVGQALADDQRAAVGRDGDLRGAQGAGGEVVARRMGFSVPSNQRGNATTFGVPPELST